MPFRQEGSVDSPLVINNNIFSNKNSSSIKKDNYSNNNSNSNNNKMSVDDDGVREKHIEVCVRLRPIDINNGPSTSFFLEKNKRNSNGGTPNSGRKPPIPSSSRVSGLRGPTSSKLKSPKNRERPIPEKPQYEDTGIYAWDVVSPDTVAQHPDTEIIQGRTHMYTLDRVYGPRDTTAKVYKQSVQPLVHAAMEGYHTAILAYGQTSTGKTFTMSGVPSSPGLIPLAISDCFADLQNEREYLLRLSYLEVYKEHIRDLLTDDTTVPVRLFDHKKDGLVIRGLKEQVVTTPQQVFDLLAQGESRRQVGATTMNQHSSRSHAMVRIWIESKPIHNGNSNNNVRASSLSLVDLAGSESVKLNGSHDAKRTQEGHYINKSLMTLGQVVLALSENKTGPGTHIPYRDSKLTRLLQPCLSGNAQMALICCISPNVSHIEESHNTFKFATRAKKIPQKATIQVVQDDDKTLLQTYRQEIEALKQQLEDAKQQQEKLLQQQLQQQQQQSQPLGRENSATSISFSDDDEIQELVDAISTMEKLIIKSKTISQEETDDYDLLIDDIMDDDNDNFNHINNNYNNNNANSETDDALSDAITTNTATTAASTASATSPPSTPPSYSLSAATGNQIGSVDNTAMDPTNLNASFATGSNLNSSFTIGTPSDYSKMLLESSFSAQPVTTKTPTEDLTKELHRVQGLLGSVLKKRTLFKKNPNLNNKNRLPPTHNNNDDDQQVKFLRLQLEQQEITTNLRKADSTFLQQQLEQKDDLLQEVSKILEALEERQIELETENGYLKRELKQLRAEKESWTQQKSENGV